MRRAGTARKIRYYRPDKFTATTCPFLQHGANYEAVCLFTGASGKAVKEGARNSFLNILSLSFFLSSSEMALTQVASAFAFVFVRPRDC